VAANFIYRKLRGTGREVFAVNPNADGDQGDHCYHDLSYIFGSVGAVFIAAHPRAASGLVRELEHSSGLLNPSRFMGRALSLRAIALDRCASA
jgi:predicted CoA-binding protein